MTFAAVRTDPVNEAAAFSAVISRFLLLPFVRHGRLREEHRSGVSAEGDFYLIFPAAVICGKREGTGLLVSVGNFCPGIPKLHHPIEHRFFGTRIFRVSAEIAQSFELKLAARLDIFQVLLRVTDGQRLQRIRIQMTEKVIGRSGIFNIE